MILVQTCSRKAYFFLFIILITHISWSWSFTIVWCSNERFWNFIAVHLHYHWSIQQVPNIIWTFYWFSHKGCRAIVQETSSAFLFQTKQPFFIRSNSLLSLKFQSTSIIFRYLKTGICATKPSSVTDAIIVGVPIAVIAKLEATICLVFESLLFQNFCSFYPL